MHQCDKKVKTFSDGALVIFYRTYHKFRQEHQILPEHVGSLVIDTVIDSLIRN